MEFGAVDWSIVVIPFLVVCCVAVFVQRRVRGVVDFLAAGRSAGRYLVCNAVGEASTGAIGMIAIFEMTYKAGFAINWWQTFTTPVALLLALTGFVVYRFRETRALTLAQFFEIRYSKSFRAFMGFLAFVSGIVNYGIFPAVGGRFFVYYCGLPEHVPFGAVHVPTFGVVMLFTLGGSLIFSLMGGQLTAMVVDCIEGMVSGIVVLLLIGVVLYLVPWERMIEALSYAPPKQSMLNPFDTGAMSDFNIWYIVVGMFQMVYSAMSWQGNQGFNSSAANPHEAKMGRILGYWRNMAKTLVFTVLAVGALTFMQHTVYHDAAAPVRAELDGIANSEVRRQMTVPIALSHLFPTGLRGVFAAIVLFALISCDSSYLHSWGSIFIQDCVLPFRRVPLSARRHIFLLRVAIAGVAIFAFGFSLVFQQTDYLLMFLDLTGAIFLGGAGSVIIGGLYWEKGTTAGAWAGMITGSVLAGAGIVLQQIIKDFPVNGRNMYAIAMAAAIAVYVVVSLVTCREPANLNRILHRGKYAIGEDGTPMPLVENQTRLLDRLLGIDSQFTWGDKLQSILLLIWILIGFVTVVGFTIWNIFVPWSVHAWSLYWYIVGVLVPLVIGVVTTIWFTWGGIRDLRLLLWHLKTTAVNPHDDGTVATHRNLDEVERDTAADPEAEVVEK